MPKRSSTWPEIRGPIKAPMLKEKLKKEKTCEKPSPVVSRAIIARSAVIAGRGKEAVIPIK